MAEDRRRVHQAIGGLVRRLSLLTGARVRPMRVSHVRGYEAPVGAKSGQRGPTTWRPLRMRPTAPTIVLAVSDRSSGRGEVGVP